MGPTPAYDAQTPAYFAAHGVSSVATPGGAMLPSYDLPTSEDSE